MTANKVVRLKIRFYFERRIRRLLADNAETGWECGDDANFVSYATIPARIFKIINI